MMISEIISIFTKILFTAILAVVVKFLVEYFYLKYKLRKIPSIDGLPFFGIALDLLKVPLEDQQQYLTNLSNKFNGHLFVIWLGTQPFINIQKPHQMEILLPSTVNIRKSVFYKFVTPWLGNGLLTSTGNQWFHQRRLITPAFHFGVLELFIEVFYEQSKTLNNCLESFVLNNPGKPLDIFTFASKFTLDVICETAMGVNIDAQQTKDNEYSQALYESSYLISVRFMKPWLFSDFLYTKTEDGKKFMNAIKIMHDFTYKVIREKMARRNESHRNDDSNEDDFVFLGKSKRKAFLDLLLDASENDENPLSIDEIREQVDTFMFAGHDTTATAITWTLFVLGNEPSVQEKVHEELNEIFRDTDDILITNAKIRQLKYLDRVTKEVLRLYPSAPFISRDLCEDTVIDGYMIPKGSCVSVNVLDLHRDPEVWENPLKFDPDRFLPENCKGRHAYAYIPFSAGPRNCIGQKFAMLELKVALTAILSKWSVKSVETVEEIKFQPDLILRASKPIEILLTPYERK